MKAKLFTLLVALFGIILSFQVSAENEKRNVSSFSEISLNVPGKLHLKQGQPQSLEIDAKSSTLEKIITEVKGDKLIIRFKSKNYFWRNFKPGEIEIYVTVPEIEALAVSGSGDILAEDAIKARNMDLAVSGSGDIKLAELSAERVSTSISGSGDILVEDGGNADKLTISISGSGDVNTAGFEAEDVSVKIAGSGNAKVYASETLNVSVAGSGDVYYEGNPNINSSVAGSGSVRKMH